MLVFGLPSGLGAWSCGLWDSFRNDRRESLFVFIAVTPCEEWLRFDQAAVDDDLAMGALIEGSVAGLNADLRPETDKSAVGCSLGWNADSVLRVHLWGLWQLLLAPPFRIESPSAVLSALKDPLAA